MEQLALAVIISVILMVVGLIVLGFALAKFGLIALLWVLAILGALFVLGCIFN